MSDQKTITFVILKKNQKYFAATKNGYKCKIVIDDNSKDLELGEQSLLVLDESVRTKFGTDLIYRLAADAAEQKSAGICTIKHPIYNSILVDECRSLGGQWDAAEKVWVFSDIVEEQVEALDAMFNDENQVTVEITAKNDLFGSREPVDFLGYTIARASGRDSGATLGDEVYKISGKINSGGSVKNWGSEVSEGSVFKLKISKHLLGAKIETESKYWDVKEII